uniref:Uncharacterized protein n=1 Tax=Ficus carica TaxID=3494 RepID=A0AA87YQB9_FICCA|nr:hypothetical protein TIFTF001_050021 [Ficus carica]
MEGRWQRLEARSRGRDTRDNGRRIHGGGDGFRGRDWR